VVVATSAALEVVVLLGGDLGFRKKMKQIDGRARVTTRSGFCGVGISQKKVKDDVGTGNHALPWLRQQQWGDLGASPEMWAISGDLRSVSDHLFFL
jgi:hypothetical protein